MPHRTDAFDEEQEHIRLATAMMEAFRPIVVPADAVRRNDADLEAALQVIRFYAADDSYDSGVMFLDRGQMARDFLQKRIDSK
jgi:hypothetical protein